MNKERDHQIVEEIDKNQTPFETLAERFGVTKQRISQIYYKLTGQYRGHIKNVRNEMRRQKRDEEKRKIKFHCASCGRGITFRTAGRLVKYCPTCHKKSSVQRKDMLITLRCQGCEKKFHPYRSKRTLRKFCSRECYYLKMSKKPLWKRKRYAEEMAAQRKG